MARRLTLIIVLIVVLTAVFPAAKTSALTLGTINITIDCTGFSGTADVVFDRENHGTTTSEAWRVTAVDGDGTTIYDTGTLTTGGPPLPIGPVDIVGPLDTLIGLTWQTAPASNPITMTIYSLAGTDSQSVPVGEESYFLAQGTCPGLPDGTAVAGCDTLMSIPTGSVVGLFVADADLYWAPGQLTNPLATIGAGNTAWVLGKDASGAYYKILWVCNYYWVPIGTMGPNPDDVWNSAPLPTGVVE